MTTVRVTLAAILMCAEQHERGAQNPSQAHAQLHHHRSGA